MDITNKSKRWMERVLGVVPVDLIRALEEDETYYGLISQISTEERVSLMKAHARVEAARARIGLRPRFASYYSYIVMRGRFFKHQGQTRTFNYRQYDI